ncbi:hypothetical protein GCM10029963_71800 [Micromonospora andamanensis]
MIEIRYGSQVCGELTSAASREWLVPDGLGGYAMGTVAGLRTRRYHGLLVIPGETPASRKVGLVSLDPAVLLPSGARVRLGAHEWASGDVDPRGFELLERFDLTDGLPRWRWRIGDVVIERELAMLPGRSCVAVVHRLVSGGPVELELAAACTWRDAHGERRGDGPPLRMDPVDGGAVIEGAYRLSGPGWSPQGHWWRGVYHREEAARGLHPEEDLWYAGQFRDTLHRSGDTLSVLAWAHDPAPAPPPAVEVVAAARRRNREVVAAARPADDVEATLALAADAFVVRTNDNAVDVVAGYPWFGAWSRDTMISYEGLFLRTGRADLGRELLRSYAATLSEGMLANTADTGRVEYNTVDGTLWFLHAVSRHVTVTGDTDLGDELLPALRAVIDAHVAGTRYGIAVDPADGLLTCGAPGAALTWMDARVYGVPVTPATASRSRSTPCGSTGWPASPSSPNWPGRTPTGCTGCTSGRSRRSGTGSPPRPAGCMTWSTRRHRRTRSVVRPSTTTTCCAPTSCWPGRCRSRRWSRTVRRWATSAPGCSPRSARAASPRLSRVPGPAPGRSGRAGHRVPPGHGLAVADRPVRRRQPSGRAAGRRPVHRSGGAPERVRPRVGERDRRRYGTAHRHRMPFPGMVGRGAAARPPVALYTPQRLRLRWLSSYDQDWSRSGRNANAPVPGASDGCAETTQRGRVCHRTPT